MQQQEQLLGWIAGMVTGAATAGAVRLAGRDQGLAAGQWAVFVSRS